MWGMGRLEHKTAFCYSVGCPITTSRPNPCFFCNFSTLFHEIDHKGIFVFSSIYLVFWSLLTLHIVNRLTCATLRKLQKMWAVIENGGKDTLRPNDTHVTTHRRIKALIAANVHIIHTKTSEPPIMGVFFTTIPSTLKITCSGSIFHSSAISVQVDIFSQEYFFSACHFIRILYLHVLL